MLRVVKRGLYGAACRAGVPAIARRRHRHQLLILTYHGLRDGSPPLGTSWSLLPVREFDSQLAYLTRHYRIVTIDRAVQELRAGMLTGPTACLTFDDGYRSNRELGLELLRRYDVPATIYLATGMIGTQRLIWTMELDLAFQQTKRSVVELSRFGLGRVRLDGIAQRAALARQVVAVLKPLPPAQREMQLAQLRAELDCPQPDHGGAYDFLTWDEVSDMENTGLVMFGAHTINHEIVSTLDDDELAVEICDSITEVRSRVRNPSATFAYPNGTRADFDRRAADVLRRRGCMAAVTTIEGLNGPATDPFELRRFNVGSNMSLDEFRLLTSGTLTRRARI